MTTLYRILDVIQETFDMWRMSVAESILFGFVLDFNTFLAIVQRSALSNDLETITHLFNALSTTQNSDSVSESGSDSEDKTVDHEAFEVFYNTWKQVRLLCIFKKFVNRYLFFIEGDMT